MPDISELDWANEAFGSSPEATNLWIGSDESVTSFHKVCINSRPQALLKTLLGPMHLHCLQA